MNQAGSPVLTPVDETATKDAHAVPWQVIVLNDDVNLMNYVVMVFMTVLEMTREQAERHMLEVHQAGKSLVWTGEKEKAEMYVQQLLSWHLNAQLQPAP